MDMQPPSDRWLKSLIFISDLIGIALAYTLASTLRLRGFTPEQIFSSPLLAFAAINLASLYLFDLYRLGTETVIWRNLLQVFGAAAISGCVIILFSYLSGAIEFRGLIGRGVLIGSQLLFAFWAGGLRWHALKWLRKTSGRSRWLLVGTEDYIQPFIADLVSHRLMGTYALLTPEAGQAQLSGRAEDKAEPNPAIQRFLHLGEWNQLERLSKEPWSSIIVCAGNSLPDALVEILMQARLRGIRVIDLADFYEQTWLKVPVFYLQRSWFAMAQGFQLLHNPIGLRLKRLFDVIGAIFLLIATSPLLLLTAIAVKLESRGPLIYSQTRVGANGELFTVYKLRSMRTDAESDGAKWTTVGDPRVTRVGALIRATRIDELPQLINVIRGDMSFVGPRPERPEFTGQLEAEIPFYGLRHLLRPGITGWAQVMYPYGASVEDARQKLQFELYYIKNYSLLLDAAIVLKTVRVVLFGRGR